MKKTFTTPAAHCIIKEKTGGTNVKKRIIRILAVILSAVATGLAVSYYLPSAIEFVSLTPFLFILFSRTDEQKWIRRGLGLGFLYFYAYYLTVWHWFLGMYPLDFTNISRGGALAVVIVAWLGLPLIQTAAAMWQVPIFLFTAKSPLTSRGGKLRASAPLAYGAVYIFFEWIQTLTWAGVPWGRLAIGQSFTPAMVGTASLFGSYFVSFVIVTVNGYIAYAAYVTASSKRDGESLRDAFGRERVRAAASVSAAVLVLAANYTYGAVRILIINNAEPKETVTVSVLQGNVSSSDKWSDGSYSNLIGIYSALTGVAADAGADMAVFPETAIPRYANLPYKNYDMGDDLEALSSDSGTVLIATGFWADDDDADRNAVFAVDPGTGLDGTAVYYKRHLVPFGEFVPFEDVIRVLVPPLADLGLFGDLITPGDSATLITTRYGRVGALVCFDSIYETAALDEVREGAELLTVSTNDSWFDGSAAIMQHAAQSVLRAVECDRYVCRAGNTGFSCIISPTGEIVAETEVLRCGIATYDVEMRGTRTPYSYIGNAFVGAAGVFITVCAAAAVIDKRRKLKGST